MAHVDDVEPFIMPCDAMGMIETDPGVALPLSEHRCDFVGDRVDSSDGPVFIICNVDVVGVVEAQVFG